ncbi:MAG: S-methyl-5-thioribose-1-phosphate isomerase [Saprospiraceae bacterium]|nr:S-methyl-5-thioribose-1-phosphate isomerase [Saprospiraceae bacterium]
MQVGKNHFRTIWRDENDPTQICIIDQRYLPFEFVIETIATVDDMATAIRDMHLRGAGLIGAAAGYGMYLAALEAKRFPDDLLRSAKKLIETRPTAVNLSWAVSRQLQAIGTITDPTTIRNTMSALADEIANDDASRCQQIGLHGYKIIEQIAQQKSGPVNILSHCNAGWLAFVDFGSATAPIYAAQQQGIPVHVWVDETRPRNQGAHLTAWELHEQGVPHTIISDNTGGHLMQHGLVDLVITGTDRTTRTGDVANKIGTYLKALAAFDNHIPFYVALPSSSFDWKITDGIREIPIEMRNEKEVKYIRGRYQKEIRDVLVANPDSPAANYAFDVTPARLISGLITERGVCEANEQSILKLFPEQRK